MHPETPQIVKPKGEKYMQRVKMILSMSGLVLALSVPSWAQVRELPTQTVTIAGTVEAIDQAKRAVNIKTATGELVAVNAGDKFQEFARADLGEGSFATPAVSGGRMYLRTFTHLISVGGSAASSSSAP